MILAVGDVLKELVDQRSIFDKLSCNFIGGAGRGLLVPGTIFLAAL